jgi:hypothetical protein
MNDVKTLSIAGAAVYWNCAAESDREKIAEELAAIGQEDLAPGKRTAFAAAKRAAQNCYSGAGYHIGNLKDRAGVTIERVVHSDDTENEYPQVAYLLVDEATGDIKTLAVIDTTLNTDQRIGLRESLRKSYEQALEQCGASSVGIALTKACDKLGGVSLRDNGGVWFIPEFSLDLFKKITSVFERNGNHGRSKVQSLTVAKTDETIRGVHDSLCGGITQRIVDIRTELAADAGKRLRKNRKAEVEKLLDQAKAYESLLDSSLDDTKKALEELKTQLTIEKVSAAGASRSKTLFSGGLGALEVSSAS